MALKAEVLAQSGVVKTGSKLAIDKKKMYIHVYDISSDALPTGDHPFIKLLKEAVLVQEKVATNFSNWFPENTLITTKVPVVIPANTTALRFRFNRDLILEAFFKEYGELVAELAEEVGLKWYAGNVRSKFSNISDDMALETAVTFGLFLVALDKARKRIKAYSADTLEGTLNNVINMLLSKRMQRDLEHKYGPNSTMRRIVEQCLVNDCFYYKPEEICGAVEKGKVDIAKKCQQFCHCYVDFRNCDMLKKYIGMTREQYERDPAPAFILWPEMPTVTVEFSFRTPPGIYEKVSDGRRHIYRLPNIGRAIELIRAITEPQHVQAFLKIAGGHRFLPRYDHSTGKIIEMRPGGVPLYIGSTLTGIAGISSGHGHRRGGGGGGERFDAVIQEAKKVFGPGSSTSTSAESSGGLIESESGGKSTTEIEMGEGGLGLLG